MGNIVSSTVEFFPQKDGTQIVHETHIDIASIVHDVVYTTLSSVDVTKTLSSRANDLGINLGLAEINDNINGIASQGSLFSPIFLYSTVGDNVTALRLAYKSMTALQSIMVGDFLNTLTNNQLQLAFGLTSLQTTTLRSSQLLPDASTALSIRTAVGS